MTCLITEFGDKFVTKFVTKCIGEPSSFGGWVRALALFSSNCGLWPLKCLFRGSTSKTGPVKLCQSTKTYPTGILAFAIIDLFCAKSWKCLDVLYAQLGASGLFEFGGVAPR